MNKKSIYTQSEFKMRNGLYNWKHISGENHKYTYEEYNVAKRIIFTV